MSEFFIELYSEEIPHNLQKNARDQFKHLFLDELNKNEIKFKDINVFSTPKRIALFVDKISLEQKIPPQEVKGPKVGCDEKALEGFLRSKSAEKKT